MNKFLLITVDMVKFYGRPGRNFFSDTAYDNTEKMPVELLPESKKENHMSLKKGSSRIQTVITQFSYDHRCADSRLNKIRKNADELNKFLDSLSPGGKNKKEK